MYSLMNSGVTNSILKELYTIKSDSLTSKTDFIKKMLLDGEYDLKDRYDSKTKSVVTGALKMLGLVFMED